MMDALATENPTGGDEEESKPEKTEGDSHEEEDLDERISVDIDSATELLEGEIDENTESPEASVKNETDSADSNNEVLEDEPEEESEDDEYDYVSMTKAELVELAKKRGLAVSGTKKKLISRLDNND